jgi:phospholipase/carboxylesterase
MQQPETVEVTTGECPVGSVIWLHGLGADGHDFEAIVPELRVPEALPLRFVFPHAPVRPVTINGGMAMRAWYDILSLDAEGRADEEGVRESSALLAALVRREQERGMETSRIVIAGFSQGGAIAINFALHSQDNLAGLMALSAYIPLPGELENSAGYRDLPVFMAHGSFDPMLPMQWGRSSADRLVAAGFDVDWHEYPMAHAVCAEEINQSSTRRRAMEIRNGSLGKSERSSSRVNQRASSSSPSLSLMSLVVASAIKPSISDEGNGQGCEL